jgi:signal transduction histidine kinase
MARIVLIDDDHSLREVSAELLADAGHEITQAGSGVEGIAAIRATRPDLVICDIQMPGMDGYAVLQAVRADAELASTSFLFMTGLDTRQHLRAAMNLGADDFLAKPLTPGDLAAAVEARLARREEASREAQRRVEEVKRSVSLLLPHELRTPLTIILGNSELLQSRYAALPPREIGRMAEDIFRAGLRLRRMAENYLLQAGMELNRLSAGSGGRPLSGATPSAVVGEAAQAQARERGRERDVLALIAPATLPLPEPYVRKIASELVDNALKFSTPGQSVRVSVATAGAAVELAIADQGRGMTAAQVRQIEAFRQFDRAIYEQQGSGLGLVLVKGIVDASGGTLRIESHAGQGTSVQATWPAR